MLCVMIFQRYFIETGFLETESLKTVVLLPYDLLQIEAAFHSSCNECVVVRLRITFLTYVSTEHDLLCHHVNICRVVVV